MRPYSGFQTMTADEVENSKKVNQFDRLLVDWLVPPNHPLRKDPRIVDDLEAVVAREVNPHIIDHSLNGAHKVMRSAFQGRPRGSSRPDADPLSGELASFLSRTAQSKGGGSVFTRRDARNYSRALRKAIEEVVWRNRIREKLGKAATASYLNFLKGNWQPVFGEVDGDLQTGEEMGLLPLLIHGNYYTSSAPGIGDKGAFRIDPESEPHCIDFRITSGANEGGVRLGIYSLKDNELSICYSLTGAKRPSQFSSRPNSGLVHIRYRKEE